jgi:hypothetical protein
MQLDDLKFWNDVFHSKFPKYKDQLDAILDHLPLVIISVNSHISHVFSNLQNCLITINCVTFPLVESMNTSLLANRKLVFCDLQVGASSNHVGEQKEKCMWGLISHFIQFLMALGYFCLLRYMDFILFKFPLT